MTLIQHDTLLALLCEANGTIAKVLHDTLSLDCPPRVGTAFAALLDASQSDKATHFLHCARAQGACVDWELMVLAQGKLLPLRFAAAGDAAHYLIVAGARSAMAHFARDLSASAEGELCALQPLARRLAACLASPPLDESAPLQELSRLNNELLNLQREVVRKNEALERSNRDLAEESRARQRLEEQFRTREAQLAAAQALAHLGSWDWELPTGSLAWSDEVYRIVGLAPQVVRPSPQLCLSLVHPADRPRVEKAIAEALAGSRPLLEEFRLRRPDGAERVVFWCGIVVRSPSGEPLRVLGMVQDITERKQAEAALRESEERYRTLMEHCHDLIWAVDTEGRFTFANQRCEEVSGYRLEDFRGRSFAPLAAPEDLPQVRRNLEQALAGRAVPFEVRVRHANGSLFRVAGTLAPIWKGGRVVGVVSFGRDITQQRQAGEALRQLSGQLLKVQEEERRRIARELHDSTAQKLAGMLIGLGLLEDAAADLPERARKLVTECLAAAEDCAQEIRNLSHLLHPPLLDELGLEAALDTYAAGFAQRSGIHTSLEIDPNLAGLSQGASLALFRVVQESLANVLRHAQSPSVSIQLARVRERLILEVSDQGRGMRPELLEQLRQSRPGLGLGIMGMRERLRPMRGILEIDSSLAGTTIRAIVPLDPPTS